MAIVYVITMKAREGRYHDLIVLIKRMIPHAAAWPGADLVRAAGDPATGLVTLYQEWDRVESMQAYFAWRATQGNDVADTITLLREPAVATQCEVIF